MQQYRVNYTLLIGLIIGTFVCSGAVYGVWKFQIERKSGWLLSEAKRARDSADVRKAKEYYGQYLSIHPEDMDSQLEYADTVVDVTEAPDVTVDRYSGRIERLGIDASQSEPCQPAGIEEGAPPIDRRLRSRQRSQLCIGARPSQYAVGSRSEECRIAGFACLASGEIREHRRRHQVFISAHRVRSAGENIRRENGVRAPRRPGLRNARSHSSREAKQARTCRTHCGSNGRCESEVF